MTNSGVKVIGQMASFAMIRSDEYQNKQEIKFWLRTNGEEVKKEGGSGLEKIFTRMQGHEKGRSER